MRIDGDPYTNVCLTVTLKHIDPPIWRRVLVPAEITLAQLHNVHQVAMGWTDSHLHAFRIAGTWYGIPSDDPWDTIPPIEPEDDTRIDGGLRRTGGALEARSNGHTDPAARISPHSNQQR